MKNILANYYEAINDDTSIKFDCTNGSAVCVLPKAKDNVGKTITIKKTDSSAYTVTVINKDTDLMYDCTLQVETATVVGAITGTGNATIVFTAANMPSSPLTISVPVENGDAIATTAKKIVGVLSTYKDITNLFTLENSGATVIITSKKAYPNDSTLNLSIDNGTCTGLTTAASSANTTAGVGITVSTQNAWKTFESNGVGWVKVDEGGINETETLVNKTLTSPVITSPDLTFGVASHNYGAAATDWTLSATELKALRIIVTNASGAVNAIATPTAGKMYVILNTSGQALTFKATGQTGVTIASTKSAIVIGNGTDFVRVTADA